MLKKSNLYSIKLLKTVFTVYIYIYIYIYKAETVLSAVSYIYIYIYILKNKIPSDECAIMKQACRDEIIVSLFFSPIATYIMLYFYISSTVKQKNQYTDFPYNYIY